MNHKDGMMDTCIDIFHLHNSESRIQELLKKELEYELKKIIPKKKTTSPYCLKKTNSFEKYRQRFTFDSPLMIKDHANEITNSPPMRSQNPHSKNNQFIKGKNESEFVELGLFAFSPPSVRRIRKI